MLFLLVKRAMPVLFVLCAFSIKAQFHVNELKKFGIADKIPLGFTTVGSEAAIFSTFDPTLQKWTSYDVATGKEDALYKKGLKSMLSFHGNDLVVFAREDQDTVSVFMKRENEKDNKAIRVFHYFSRKLGNSNYLQHKISSNGEYLMLYFIETNEMRGEKAVNPKTGREVVTRAMEYVVFDKKLTLKTHRKISLLPKGNTEEVIVKQIEVDNAGSPIVLTQISNTPFAPPSGSETNLLLFLVEGDGTLRYYEFPFKDVKLTDCGFVVDEENHILALGLWRRKGEKQTLGCFGVKIDGARKNLLAKELSKFEDDAFKQTAKSGALQIVEVKLLSNGDLMLLTEPQEEVLQSYSNLFVHRFSNDLKEKWVKPVSRRSETKEMNGLPVTYQLEEIGTSLHILMNTGASKAGSTLLCEFGQTGDLIKSELFAHEDYGISLPNMALYHPKMGWLIPCFDEKMKSCRILQATKVEVAQSMGGKKP